MSVQGGAQERPARKCHALYTYFYDGRPLSRQNQKPHGKNKNITAKPKTSWQKQKHHGKTKNLTAKPNTSQQKQNSFDFAVGICFCREVFGFCCEVFGFAMRSLVLPWGFWFCREVFCFCCEVFGFAVRYFVFAVRFSVLPWGILFLPWGFWFCRNSCGPPYIYKECLEEPQRLK